VEQVIWKPVVGFEDRYEVSNDGRVRSLDIHVPCRGGKTRLYKGRVKPTYRNNRGYLVVNLCRDNKGAYSLVHRLVAEAFIDNPQGKPQVNHIDGNLNNNRADNLEWVTDNENKAHSSIAVGGTQRPKKAVVVINRFTGQVLHFCGLREAERALSLDHGTAMKVLRGRQRTHRGYYIAYANGGDA
jgi:hypothetical protein